MAILNETTRDAGIIELLDSPQIDQYGADGRDDGQRRIALVEIDPDMELWDWIARRHPFYVVTGDDLDCMLKDSPTLIQRVISVWTCVQETTCPQCGERLSGVYRGRPNHFKGIGECCAPQGDAE